MDLYENYVRTCVLINIITKLLCLSIDMSIYVYMETVASTNLHKKNEGNEDPRQRGKRASAHETDGKAFYTIEELKGRDSTLTGR